MRRTLGILLVGAVWALPGASADIVGDTLLGAVALADETARTAAGTATGASSAATSTANDAVQGGAGVVQGVVSGAAQQAGETVVGAGEAFNAALGEAAAAPGPLVAEANRRYDLLEEVPPIAGDYVQERISSVPALDDPILRDFGATYDPWLRVLDEPLTVRVEEGEVHIGLLTWEPPDPADLVGDTEAFAQRSAVHAEAWAWDSLADTEAFVPEVVARVVG